MGLTPWTPGDKGWDVAIGAPIMTVSDMGDLARISGAAYWTYSPALQKWTQRGSGGASGHMLTRVPNTPNVVYVSSPGTSGNLYHSPDGGVTWNLALAANQGGATNGVYGVDYGADGTLWAWLGNGDASGTDGAITKATMIFKSTDGGATWVLVHTLPGWDGSFNRNRRPQSGFPTITADKGNPNRVFAVLNSVVEGNSIYTLAGGDTWTITGSSVDAVPRGAGSADAIRFAQNGRLLYMRSQGTPSMRYADPPWSSWGLATVEGGPFGGVGEGLGMWRPVHAGRAVVAFRNPSGGSDSWIFATENHGALWRRVGTVVTPQASSVAFHHDTGAIVVSTFSGGANRVVLIHDALWAPVAEDIGAGVGTQSGRAVIAFKREAGHP
jgi:hypothetical protein